MVAGLSILWKFSVRHLRFERPRPRTGVVVQRPDAASVSQQTARSLHFLPVLFLSIHVLMVFVAGFETGYGP
jgi:hypothetical protein